MTATVKKTRKKKTRKKIIHWRPTPAEKVREWRDKHGFTERGAAEILGISRGFLNSCEEKGAPYYIGLAMSAYDAGLKPYGTEIADEDFRRVE